MRFSITVFCEQGRPYTSFHPGKKELPSVANYPFNSFFFYIKFLACSKKWNVPSLLPFVYQRRKKTHGINLQTSPALLFLLPSVCFVLGLIYQHLINFLFFFNKEQRMQRFFSPHGKSETLWVMCLKNILRFLKRKIIFLKMKIKCSPYTGFYIRGGYCPSSI